MPSLSRGPLRAPLAALVCLRISILEGSVELRPCYRHRYNSTGFIDMETNYQSGDAPPTKYAPTVVRNVSFENNRAVGAGVGASWVCSANDACDQITVINNTVLHAAHPWSCHYVKSYRVAGNAPVGLDECMATSMNRSHWDGVDPSLLRPGAAPTSEGKSEGLAWFALSKEAAVERWYRHAELIRS